MVARAGALVSPALISPPSPLDLLRDRVPSPAVVFAVLLLCEAGKRGGKASVAGMVSGMACDWIRTGRPFDGRERRGGM
jgi:hypothetical protein